jgi:hypothetical protein
MRRDVIQPVSVVAIDPNDPAIAVFAQVFLTVAARRRFLRRLRIARITPKGLMPEKTFQSWTSAAHGYRGVSSDPLISEP